jgi:integrase
VSWYWGGKEYKIPKYKGRLMHSTHPNKKKDHGFKTAEKLLAQMQGDVENGIFRIEKFTSEGWTDVIPYFEKWLDTKVSMKPATYKGYKSYFKNWIKPFFEAHPVQLHEIQLDTLTALLASIKLSGKGKHNVMMCFHVFMDFAWRSKRVFEVPPFPKKAEYNLVQPTITWLPSERQISILDAIPDEHQPIFWFLKYHLRRPSEACALHKVDYDIINKVFTIRRSISARKLVNSTKTGKEHVIPCHSNMIQLIDYLSQLPGDYMFQNPRARKDGRRYTNESLNIIWRAACAKVGEKIDLYSGLKHSSCSQFVNEQHMALSDLQTITDHARLDSVERYAKTEVARKRELMESGGKLAGLLRLVK